MARQFNNKKTWQQKLQELKDLATGKKTLASLARANMPGRTIITNVRKTADGIELYYVGWRDPNKRQEEDGMTKEEYDIWLEAEREKGPISHVLNFVHDSRNEPINDDEDKDDEYRITETEITTFEDGLVWNETKQYGSGQDKEPTHLGLERLKVEDATDTTEPIEQVKSKKEKIKVIKKEKSIKQPIIVKKGNEIIGETFKMPAFRREIDPGNNFVSSVTRLFDNATRFKL